MCDTRFVSNFDLGGTDDRPVPVVVLWDVGHINSRCHIARPNSAGRRRKQ